MFGTKSVDDKSEVIVSVGVCEQLPELQNAQRTKEEIRTLLRKAGVDYCTAKFEAVWLRAMELEIKAPEEELTKTTVCMRSVMSAIRELHYL